MSLTIEESGMTFGPFAKSELFIIEQSQLYKNLGDGVKMVEFVLNRSPDVQEPILYLVEAKQSSPVPENVDNFSGYIKEITEKMVNGISLVLAAILHRHGPNEDILPETMRSIDLSRCTMRCILVINGHKDSWLPPIQDALRKSLLAMNKTWNFDPNMAVVLNHALAAKHRLIQAM